MNWRQGASHLLVAAVALAAGLAWPHPEARDREQTGPPALEEQPRPHAVPVHRGVGTAAPEPRESPRRESSPREKSEEQADEAERLEADSVSRAEANRRELIRTARPSATQLATIDGILADMNTRLLALHDAAPLPDDDPAVERRASLERTVETLQIVLEAELELQTVLTEEQRAEVPVNVLDASTWITPALASELE